MTLFKDYIKRNTKEFDSIELYYSVLHFVSGNHNWFCRVYVKDWILHIRFGNYMGEAYGKNKFEAYRNAIKDLKKGKCCER